MKTLKLGGQAVLEGIMMKSTQKYAVSIRTSDFSIITKTWDYNHPIINKFKKIFFLCVLISLVESFYIGMKTLNFSSDYYLGEKEKTNVVLNILFILLSFCLAIFFFIFLPFTISILFKKITNSNYLVILFEGIIRIVIFIGYLIVISSFKDIKRVFMYHGAEHKCINCIENKQPLTIENVKKSSREHKRCGTSFIIFVLLVSLIVGFFINAESIILKLTIRILLLPLISAISYEIIMLSARSDFIILRMISKIGLAFQKLTNKEPTNDMIEVAITTVNQVFNMKDYLKSEQ